MPRPVRMKGAIERSALELFVEKGVDGTSIRDIAERAGVTEGALYRHHKGKNDLVRALFFDHYEAFAEIIKRVRARHDLPEELLPALVREFFQFYDEDPFAFEFILLVQHRLLDEVRQDDRNPVELISRILREAIRNKQLPRQDANLTTQLLIGLVMQPAIGARYGRVKRPLANHAAFVGEACLRLVRQAEET